MSRKTEVTCKAIRGSVVLQCESYLFRPGKTKHSLISQAHSHTHSNSCTSFSHLLYSFLALSLMYPACLCDVCFKQQHHFFYYLAFFLISRSLSQNIQTHLTRLQYRRHSCHSCGFFSFHISVPLSLMWPSSHGQRANCLGAELWSYTLSQFVLENFNLKVGLQ